MDVFGIVYIIENPQQFWSGTSHIVVGWMQPSRACAELEDILRIPNELTLEQLDSALRRFVSFCACYHGTCKRLVPSVTVSQYL